MNRFALVPTLFFILFLSACTNRAEIRLQSISQTIEIAKNYTFTEKRTLFSADDKQLNEKCTWLNDTTGILIETLKKQIGHEAAEVDSMFPPQTDRPAFQFQLYITDSVFMATPEFISFRLTAYQYTGGAHGITTFYAFNFDVKQNRFLTISEILPPTNARQIDSLLQTSFKNPYDCFNEKPTLANVTVVNIGKTSVCFTYAHYILGPYACGSAEIDIPLQIMKQRKLLNIR